MCDRLKLSYLHHWANFTKTWILWQNKYILKQLNIHTPELYSESCQISKMDGFFLRKKLLKANNYFHKTLHLRCWLGSRIRLWSEFLSLHTKYKKNLDQGKEEWAAFWAHFAGTKICPDSCNYSMSAQICGHFCVKDHFHINNFLTQIH